MNHPNLLFVIPFLAAACTSMFVTQWPESLDKPMLERGWQITSRTEYPSYILKGEQAFFVFNEPGQYGVYIGPKNISKKVTEELKSAIHFSEVSQTIKSLQILEQ